MYPGVHATLELERVNGHALLFRWPGTGADPAARPAVLMPHYDVVPAGDPDAWTRPPFSGHNDGTYLWGRGTLDDKGQLAAILEAAETLVGAGFAAAHDIYFSFGDNEETAGDSAAAPRRTAGTPRCEALAGAG
ncbi:M20/M25/M40 family metallo-hydrolase [Arthrobacter sp. MP_2.3]|uniref:M20/M25/M40 family metallo-hydrolase n=1 Tax=Arthrobacter sp. MP_2.3 TaxID=3349633 RepID=UPI0038D37312